MNFKPGNFYISIIDLFAILLPGAIATLVIYYYVNIDIEVMLSIPGKYVGFYSSFLFILSAYLLGHIISQFSAYLDKWVYDKLKDKFYTDNKRLKLVKEIRKRYDQVEDAEKYLNNFEWAKSKLLKDMPEAVTEIERYMADSKFFRGLIIILLVLLFIFLKQSQSWIVGLCFLLAAFSTIRYFHKRRKATETTYKYIIFLEKMSSEKDDLPPVPVEPDKKNEDQQTFKPLQSKVDFLQTGFSDKLSHVEIPARTIWTSPENRNQHDFLYCFQGRGLLNYTGAANSESDVILTPNASINILQGKQFQIQNQGNEKLLVLFVKIST